MATGDVTDLATAACRVARRDPTTSSYLAQAEAWINEAHRATIDADVPWDFLQATGTFDLTAGTDVYTHATIAAALGLPAIRNVLFLVNNTTGGPPLEPGSWDNLERATFASQFAQGGGAPLIWAEWGTGTADAQIRVWPKPDQAYELGIRVRRQAEDLEGEDFPLIPGGHARALLVPYAAARLWEGQSGAEALRMAQSQDARYAAAFAALVAAHGSAQEPNLRLAEVSFGWDLPGGAKGSWW